MKASNNTSELPAIELTCMKSQNRTFFKEMDME